MDVKAAQVGDAGELAELINLAGEGIPAYIWSQMAEPGQTPLEVGASGRRGRRVASVIVMPK